VQDDGFVAIYSHLGMAVPSFAQGKRTVTAGEKLGVVGRNGVTVGTHVYLRWTSLASQSIQHRTWEYPDAMVRFIKRQMTDRIQKARLSEGGSII
jgi:hypothetical protein